MAQEFASEAHGDRSAPETRARWLRLWLPLLALVLVVFGVTSYVVAANSQIAFAKNFCIGIPPGADQPSDCELATSVPMNTPVFYTFTVTNPWGQPQQTVDLIDANLKNPSSFGFTPTGSLFCRDDLGNPVTAGPSTNVNGIAQITLDIGRTVTCFVPGMFTTTGNKDNDAKAETKDGDVDSDVSTHVLGTTPLNADLSLTKTASPGTLDVTGGADTVTYTITVKNNGPANVAIGDWFVLHDRFSLLPNSVPLYADLVSASCSVTASTSSTPNDCLDPGGPNLTGGSPLLVGTMGYHNFFDWEYASNSNGNLQAGATMTLTITVKVSQLNGLNCVQALNANGLRNETFFTLVNNNSALSENNPANNTAAVNVAVETGQTEVDPNCGTGHLKVTKEEVEPRDPTAWGQPVKYRIVIENVSLPQQAIEIKKNDLEDWVTEGVNTPPFTRTYNSTQCEASETTDPNDCNPFTPGINNDPDHQYSYYGESNRGWRNDEKIKLAHGEKITFYTSFTYEKPDCETVPNANPKPIINTARVTYKASAYGALSASPQNVTFTQSAEAITKMEKQPPCDFVVTKSLPTKSPPVAFGQPLNYTVTFTNNGAARVIGTVMDVGRISIPNYATSLPYSSSWTCAKSWASGAMTGSLSGFVVHTSSPAQGTPMINIGSNISFPSGGQIKCAITVTLQRPPTPDKYCTTSPALFENLALMDVTHPFNSNIAWPPSASYTLGAGYSPNPQKFNWATAEARLPKCWDAIINKSATVGGLPSGSLPWTYVGNTNPITYTITTTNTGQSNLGDPSSATPGFVVKDGFAIPNANFQVSSGNCLAAWCWTSPAPHNVKWQIGIKNLAPLANGVWTLTLPGMAVLPIQQGQSVKNKACVEAQGVQAGPGWYNNSGTNSKCDEVAVPVIKVTKISVRKQLIDQTGAGVTAVNGFGINVSCTPFAIPTSANPNFTLNTGTTGYSAYQSVYPVPMAGTCTVTETAKPIPAAIAKRCEGAANVNVVTSISPLPATLNSVDNQVTVINTYSCKVSPQLRVNKLIFGPSGAPTLTNLNFSVTANCTPATTPSTQTINYASGVGFVNFSVVAGAVCTVTENALPAFPASAMQYCEKQGGKIPVWNAPVITPTNGTVTISGPQTNVGVTNVWKCVKNAPTPQLRVNKLIFGPSGAPTLTNLNFSVTANCTPATTPSTQTINYSSGVGFVLFGVVSGANCTVTENTPLPTFPASALQYCEKQGGKIPVWNAPIITPTNGTVTISGPQTNVGVTNVWKCVTKDGPLVELRVGKRIDGPAGAPALTNMTFGVNATCTPAATPTTQSIINGTGAPSIAFAVASGANCTVTENTPLPPFPVSARQYCAAKGGTAAWKPAVITPNGSFTVGNNGSTVLIVNAWECVGNPPATGQLEVIKRFTTTPHPVAWPATNWIINTNCTPAASASSVTISTGASGSAVITGSGSVTGPVGANCIVDEPTSSLPGFPSWITSYCNNQGGKIPVWSTPTYTPSSNVTLNNGVQTVTVNNSWTCQGGNPPVGQLKVVKELTTGAIGGVSWPTTSWTINVNCTPSASASSVAVNTPASSSTVTSGNATVTAPVGANCIVNEPSTSLPPFPSWATSYCNNQGGKIPVWNAPIYTPSSNVTVGSSVQTVTVKNSWTCQGGGSGGGNTIIDLVKQVQGPPGTVMLPPTFASTFVFNSNCSTPSSPATLSITATTVGGAVTTVPTGTACNFVETLPAFPAAATNYCANSGNMIPVWETPIWSIAQPMVASGTTQVLTVTNKWKCEPKPPKPPKSGGFKLPKIKIDIGIPGLPGGGGKKDEPRKPDSDPPRP